MMPPLSKELLTRETFKYWTVQAAYHLKTINAFCTKLF
jgi:hypothetical protein